MDPSSLVYFDQQVAGHDRLLLMPTNDLMVIKPCKQRELDFYQDAIHYPDFQDFIPECYGTLRAATETDLALLDNPEIEKNETIKIDIGQNEDQNLCMENLLHGFTRPCILDLKMGSLLYDNDAIEEKRKRMTYQAEHTTSGSLGLRISGMKVYDTIERRYATYEKIYGRSRTVDNTTDAILAYLFPTSKYGKDTEDYRTYIDDNTTTPTIMKERIPTKFSRWVIECFIDVIEEIREFIIQHPNLRLIGSSILFVYEGDRAAAEKTWKCMLEEDKVNKKKEKEGEEEEEEELTPKMCDVRLIDFAHSDWHADDRKEQDPNLVKGYDNIIMILNDCLDRQNREKL
ncbi:MAG: hypothetical protein EXX96DRAFT_649723 [Benjaminiella poitrasii]|nr:MAG: hypothetical protein EXX96DRAFT_649723 [Benjaminiella poitrasii]